MPVENPDAAEAGECGWCLRKQEGAVGWPEPGTAWDLETSWSHEELLICCWSSVPNWGSASMDWQQVNCNNCDIL